jgi:hypothetical protein
MDIMLTTTGEGLTHVAVNGAPSYSGAERVARIVAGFRQEIGPDRFQALWAEVTGGEPLPDWLAGDEP